MDGNFTSIGTPPWVCRPEKEKIKAMRKRDRTAIPELTSSMRCAFPLDFLRGVENNLDDLRRFNLVTSVDDIS